jgi:hypothetical protein
MDLGALLPEVQALDEAALRRLREGLVTPGSP